MKYAGPNAVIVHIYKRQKKTEQPNPSKQNEWREKVVS